MANALRPGDILKNKRNVNPSLDPYTEARAEDFEEVSTILEDHADKLDAMVQPEKFYGFHTSLENLIAAHPTAVENGWATIIPTNGNPPYTATYTSGVWTASVSKAPIQYYTTHPALLSTTGQEGIIYVVKDQKLLYLWYDNKFNAFGKDGANGASAYEVAVALGYSGTDEEWVASLQGLDNYQLWLQNGNTGTYEDFFEASRGPRGYDGDPGAGFENIPATPDQIPVTDGVGGIAWQPKPTGGGGSNINRYLTIGAMLAGQAGQLDASVQYVADASADPTVDAGYAYYEYLGTTVGTLADYRKLSEEESMDVDPGGGSTAPKEKTGSTILFTERANYNQTTPSTSGTITLDPTGAVKDSVIAFYSNTSVEPAITGSTLQVKSGRFLPDKLNIFWFVWMGNGYTLNIQGNKAV